MKNNNSERRFVHMKTAILIAGLLMLSVITAGFIAAQEPEIDYANPISVKPMRVQAISPHAFAVQEVTGSVRPIDVAASASGIESSDIEEVLASLEADTDPSLRAAAFSRVTIGNGYAENTQGQLELTRIVLASRSLVSPQSVNEASVLHRGTLMIGNTKLKLAQENADESPDSYRFTLMYNGAEVGEAKIHATKESGSIRVFEGTFSFELTDENAAELSESGSLVLITKTVGSVRKSTADETQMEVDDGVGRMNKGTPSSAGAANSKSATESEDAAQAPGSWTRFWARLFGN